MDEEGDAGVAGRGIGLLPEVRLQHALDHPLGEVADEVVDERQDDGPVLEIEVGVIAVCLVADRKSKLCSISRGAFKKRSTKYGLRFVGCVFSLGWQGRGALVYAHIEL